MRPVLAALLLAGCTQSEPIIHADAVELIHVDTQATTINVTVTSNDGRATLVLTPRAALQLQEDLRVTFALMEQGAEALRAQQQTVDP